MVSRASVARCWRDEPANYETPTPHSRLVLHARRHSRRMHSANKGTGRPPRRCREARRETRRSLLKILEPRFVIPIFGESASCIGGWTPDESRLGGGRRGDVETRRLLDTRARDEKNLSLSLSLSLLLNRSRSLLCPWQTIERPSN